MEGPPTPWTTPPPSPIIEDPIGAHLRWARAEKERAEKSWLPIIYGDDGMGVADAVHSWGQIVHTLEALQSAARLSRHLYGDCVQLPSRDPQKLADPAILHALLMQQLDSLLTRIGDRQNVAGSVPLAVRPAAAAAVAEVKEPPPVREEAPVDEEEEQGGTCTIA